MSYKKIIDVYGSDNFPKINQRILYIISEEAYDNVRQFALAVGERDSSRINRLFHPKDGKFPEPTLPVIEKICLKYGYNANWLLFGIGPMKLEDLTAKTTTTNNITIVKNMATNESVNNSKGDNNKIDNSIKF